MTNIWWTSLIVVIILWFLGGWSKAKWSGYRDVLVPILLGILTIYYLKADIIYKGMIGILTIGTANIIRLGYSNYEEGEKNSFLGDLTKDKKGYIVRALWGFIVSLVLPLCIGIYTHKWLGWGLYIGINTLIGFIVSKFKFPVLLADICVAMGVWSVVPKLLI